MRQEGLLAFEIAITIGAMHNAVKIIKPKVSCNLQVALVTQGHSLGHKKLLIAISSDNCH